MLIKNKPDYESKSETITKIKVKCAVCGHEWEQEVKVTLNLTGVISDDPREPTWGENELEIEFNPHQDEIECPKCEQLYSN